MLLNLSQKYRILPWGPQPFHKGLGEDCTARTTLEMRGGGLYKGILGESLQRQVAEDPQSLLILVRAYLWTGEREEGRSRSLNSDPYDY